MGHLESWTLGQNVSRHRDPFVSDVKMFYLLDRVECKILRCSWQLHPYAMLLKLWHVLGLESLSLPILIPFLWHYNSQRFSRQSVHFCWHAAHQLELGTNISLVRFLLSYQEALAVEWSLSCVGCIWKACRCKHLPLDALHMAMHTDEYRQTRANCIQTHLNVERLWLLGHTICWLSA